MPTKNEKDAISGRYTTGHEWDGLQELNTPLPKWWLYTFFVSVVIGGILMLLYPSVPYGTGYFRGLLGASTRATVTADVQAMAANRAVYMNRIRSMPIEQVKQDPQLMAVANAAGRIAFATNCQPCHGAGGEGHTGYPSLADDTWLWGGTLADIQQTITYGIRSGHDKARGSVMPSFGAGGMLAPEQIQEIADFVWNRFYGHAEGADQAGAVVDGSKGAALFSENCAICHGVNGEGNRTFGAPPLHSAVHLYGDTREAIVAQINSPRLGVMPSWEKRSNETGLDEATIKSVALFVHGLGGGE